MKNKSDEKKRRFGEKLISKSNARAHTHAHTCICIPVMFSKSSAQFCDYFSDTGWPL